MFVFCDCLGLCSLCIFAKIVFCTVFAFLQLLCVRLLISQRKQVMSGGGDQFYVIKCNDATPEPALQCNQMYCNVMLSNVTHAPPKHKLQSNVSVALLPLPAVDGG